MTSGKHMKGGAGTPAGKRNAGRVPARPANGPKAPGRKATRRELGLLLALTALLAVVLVPRFGSGTGVPAELYGRWTTDDPRYADRALVITDSTVAFYRGTEPISVHRLRTIHSESGEFGGTRHDVEYESEGDPQVLTVIHEASPSGTLRLKNQPGIEWSRNMPDDN